MEREELLALLDRYRDNTCSEADVRRLVLHIQQGKDQELLGRYIAGTFEGGQEGDYAENQESLDRVRQRLLATQAEPKTTVWKLRRWVAAAAAVLLFFAGLGYWYTLSRDQNNHLIAENDMSLPLPGGNRATLTLADGRVVELSEAHEGIVIGEEGLWYDDGSGILDDREQTIDNRQADGKGSLRSSVSSLMSITTPKGGTYQITLPDGSKVFLNAESSLSYPERFAKNERRVTLAGEGYFEVSHDPAAPFTVSTARQDIQVLGTSFNVNAYAEEQQVVTTLVEGKVALKPLNQQGAARDVVLKPGQQAVLSAAGIAVRPVAAGEFTAWIQGKFIFNNTDIHAVMRQLARWYDAEVSYVGDLSDITFSGIVSRYEDIGDVLRKIELTGSVHINLTGRRIAVHRK